MKIILRNRKRKLMVLFFVENNNKGLLNLRELGLGIVVVMEADHVRR